MSDGSPSRQPSRGWRRATLAGAAVALLIMAHYGWFTVLGPPARWGTGVVTVDPTIERADAAAIQPGDRWAPDRAATFPARLSTVALDGVQGKPFELDVAGDDGMGVLQTFAGPSWTQGQRLYVRAGAAAPWRELTLPPGLMLSDACLVRPGGRPAVLVSAWQPWWPYERSYGRFVRSVLDRALRPEHAIYLLDLDGGGMRFLFPGEGLTLSPDRRSLAYVTSENDHAGFHTIAVWSAATGTSVPILSLWEADPGSGRSFGYRWSESSRALRIEGATQGFARWGRGRHQAIRLVYLVEPRRLLDTAP